MLNANQLKKESGSWHVPGTDIGSVRERARKLQVRRRLASAGISLLLLIAAGATALAVTRIGQTDDFTPAPAGDTVSGAQAATLAFHSLRETTDYADPEFGVFDYKSV